MLLQWLLSNENEALWHLKKMHILCWLLNTWLFCVALHNHDLFMCCMAELGDCDCHYTPPRVLFLHPSQLVVKPFLTYEKRQTHNSLYIQNSASATYIFFSSSCFILSCLFVRWKIKSLLQEENNHIPVSSFCWCLSYIYQYDFSSFSKCPQMFCCWKLKRLGSNYPLLAWATQLWAHLQVLYASVP